MSHRSAAILTLVLGAGAAPALAQIRLETYDMPPAPARALCLSPAPGPGFFAGERTRASFQINVNAQGMNTVGDAANEPSMTVDPTAPNRIAVGWRQFDSISSNFRKAGVAYSRDGGRSWTSAGPLDPATFRTDPVLDTTANGTFSYYSLYGTALTNCDLFESPDGGRDWEGPESALGGDKNWLGIDRSDSPGRGNIYAIWSRSFSCCGPGSFGRSIDGGASFQPAVVVPDSPYWGTVPVGPDGEVYVAGVSFSNSSLFSVSKSLTASNPASPVTWSLTRTVSLGGALRANTGTGPNPGGLNGQLWCAVDSSTGPRRGWVYMLCTVDPPTADPGDVMLVRSSDGGNTWSAPVRVNDDPAAGNAWQWMGTLGVSPDGRFDAVWIDTRESGQVNIGRLYASSSSDGGVTWSPNAAITPAWNSFVGYPQQNKIGDYYQLVSDRVGAHLAYAATFNGEQDVYYLRLGEYDCNGNGVPDSADLAGGVLHDCDLNGIPDECELAAGVQPPCACYANCDRSTVAPVLNTADFTCFLQKFAAGAAYANCDQSTAPPVLNVQDFTCFLQHYASGCH